MMKCILKILLLLLVSVFTLYADVSVEKKNHKIELLGVPYFEDKDSSVSFEEVRSKAFSVLDGSVASFGFTKSRYWFKIEISPQKDALIYKWWLNVSYPLLEELDLYICDANNSLVQVKKAGKLRPFSEREVADRNFLFQLDMSKKQILYLSVKTQSSMQVPMSIQSSQSLISHDQYILILFGLYYGVFVIIFFYNLISFMYTRKRNYFLYLVFISSFVIYQLSLDGLGIRFIWSEWDWVIHHGSGTMMSILIFTILLFTKDFLKTKEFAPFLDKVFTLIASLMFIIIIFASFRPYGDVVLYISFTAIFLPFLLISAGIIAYRRKFYPARFYVMGWGLFLAGSVLFAMNKFAFIEGLTFLAYAQQVGSALEMIFLSWALADSQKQSERQYLEKLSGLNAFLEEKVENSLIQIRKNDQILIEKSRLAAMGEMIEQIAHQWRQPLNALALINQNLYFKVQLNTASKDDCIDAHDKINDHLQYMSQTIDDFRYFSNPHKEKEIFVIEEVIQSALNLSEGSLKYAKVGTSLDSTQAHSVFGMRHEMMQVFMNLIKNVQDVVIEKNIKAPWIKFHVEEGADIIKILIEDNVGGISEEKIKKVFDPYFSTKNKIGGTGIGLYMSKEIVEKSMFGHISVINSAIGAVFEITLPKVSQNLQ